MLCISSGFVNDKESCKIQDIEITSTVTVVSVKYTMDIYVDKMHRTHFLVRRTWSRQLPTYGRLDKANYRCDQRRR